MEFETAEKDRNESGALLSMAAMRQAVRHLQQGGLGGDRDGIVPIAEPSAHPRFFRRPSALPMHPIHLALKAKVADQGALCDTASGREILRSLFGADRDGAAFRP